MLFKKELKIKSNIRLKTSQGKAFRDALLQKYPLIETDLDTLVPKKEALFCMRVVVQDNAQVLIYVAQRKAIAFSYNDQLYPSVYLLWKCPSMMLAFTTNAFVSKKLYNGADLMMAGVYMNGTFNNAFPNGTAAYVNLLENKAAIAVGVTAKSSVEMEKERNTGKCILIYHVYGDYLCQLENLPVDPMPSLGGMLEDQLLDEEIDAEEVISQQSLQADSVISSSTNQSDAVPLKETCTADSVLAESIVDDNIDKEITVEEMDTLMKTCFMAAIKYSKTLKLPILTSAFYKLEMITSCPLGKNLDIKKSSYKKLGQFLKEMGKTGLITVKELKKGAESIVAINKEHDEFVSFFLEKEYRPVKAEDEKSGTNAPNIIEAYIITPAVEHFFEKAGYRKGDKMLERDVRHYITEYVKSNNCQNVEDRKYVNLQEPYLAKLFKDKETVCWEELMEKICGSMKSCFKVSGGSREVEAKGKIQPISMRVETRTSNKKVTLVDNIDLFGISINEFAKECQHGVSASTTISKPPGKKTDQLLIQGNQVHFVYKLLTEKYKIPQRYIRGMEFAPKRK